MYVSYYGDGALYDAHPQQTRLATQDDETDEALCVYLIDCCELVASRLTSYCREGNLHGYDDAYQAAQDIADLPAELIQCGDTRPDLGPCATCGHDTRASATAIYDKLLKGQTRRKKLDRMAKRGVLGTQSSLDAL